MADARRLTRKVRKHASSPTHEHHRINPALRPARFARPAALALLDRRTGGFLTERVTGLAPEALDASWRTLLAVSPNPPFAKAEPPRPCPTPAVP